ncbi:glycosyltransferase family 39 protein [Kitasatospora sp. GP82]|uniref:glycosyltransferase family 39 protein n=1 Tax=Kitasatospora sp. GP82 TaxID=3035089 RepID=UPI00247324CD|nr:glycosyltransferase family 39 protein [Kitasatospora sp. GP82]MDH6124217.1 mannosyltransferase [Kitasatospora sp. GP82]
MTASATQTVPIAGREPGPARGSRRALASGGRFHCLWPALLTLLIGLYRSGRPALWPDELVTVSAARRSTAELFDLLGHVDAVTGAYYLLIHCWIGLFGDSQAMLRLPSALAMAGAAAFVVLTGERLFGRRAALVAGTLFALLPSVSRYAQEARGYAFAVLAVSAATWLLLRAVDRPRPLRWAVYGCAVSAAGIFHLVSLVFLAAHGVVVLARWWRLRRHAVPGQGLAGFWAAAVAGLLPVLPLALLGRRQVGRQLAWLEAPTLRYVVDVFWRSLFGSTAVSLVVLALAVLPLAWSRGRRPAYEIGLMAVLPIVLIWLVSQGTTAYFLDRYLLFTLPAWAVLAGAGLTALRPRWLAPLGLVLVLIAGLGEQRSSREPFARTNWDAKSAAAVIAQGYRPGDGLVALRGSTLAFLQVDTAIRYHLPPAVEPKDVLVARSAERIGDIYPQLCPDPVACIGNTPRVWVVATGSSVDKPLGEYGAPQADALAALFPRRTVTAVPGMIVTLLER